jgi:hypothetical protein
MRAIDLADLAGPPEPVGLCGVGRHPLCRENLIRRRDNAGRSQAGAAGPDFGRGSDCPNLPTTRQVAYKFSCSMSPPSCVKKQKPAGVYRCKECGEEQRTF